MHIRQLSGLKLTGLVRKYSHTGSNSLPLKHVPYILPVQTAKPTSELLYIGRGKCRINLYWLSWKDRVIARRNSGCGRTLNKKISYQRFLELSFTILLLTLALKSYIIINWKGQNKAIFKRSLLQYVRSSFLSDFFYISFLINSSADFASLFLSL
jgi:hypothetical protein